MSTARKWLIFGLPVGAFILGLVILANNPTHPIGWLALAGAVIAAGKSSSDEAL